MKTVLWNYVDAEFARFVVGQRPVEEVDELIIGESPIACNCNAVRYHLV